MAQRRQLERSTVETWFAIIIGIVAAVIPMSWGWECGLIAIVWLLLCDLVLHSAPAASIWLPFKLWLCFALLTILDAVSWPSIAQRYAIDHPYHMPPNAFQVGDRIATVTDNPQFIGFLLVSSAIVILWGQPVVWRARHRAIFFLRRAVTEEVWISRHAAIDLIKNSRWMSTKRPTGMSAWIAMPAIFEPGGEAKLARFCDLTTDEFESNNPKYVRAVGDQKEYREDKVRAYLRAAFDAEVTKTYGRPPGISV